MKRTYSWKRLALVIIGTSLVATGCGNPCVEAMDKINECQGGSLRPYLDCNELAECQADCYDDASCEDIKTNSASLTVCVEACAK